MSFPRPGSTGNRRRAPATTALAALATLAAGLVALLMAVGGGGDAFAAARGWGTQLTGTARPLGAGRRLRVSRRGWGDDVTFVDASVASNVEAGDGLRLISIDAPPEVAGAFKRAGQFVQAKPKPDAKPSFYAISSPPGAEGPLEFLIKEAESNEWLTSLGRGDVALLSEAMGRGFNVSCAPWSAADVSQVGLFATGTGVAPIRAVIEGGALKGKAVRLYVGARTESSLGFADRYEAWRKAGVEVVPVLSKADGGWSGRQGYVQDALKQDEERGDGFVLPARHGALLCGQKEMVAAVRGVYEGLGVPEERTLLNF